MRVIKMCASSHSDWGLAGVEAKNRGWSQRLIRAKA